MLIESLMIVALALVAMQPNAQRLYAALVLSGVNAGHDAAFGNLDGWQYYCSAAGADLAIMTLVAGMAPVPKMVLCVQRICVFSIFANFSGWLMWWLYLPPDVYNYMYIFIYAWTVAVLARGINGDDNGIRGFGMDGWRACVSRYLSTSRTNNRADISRL